MFYTNFVLLTYNLVAPQGAGRSSCRPLLGYPCIVIQDNELAKMIEQIFPTLCQPVKINQTKARQEQLTKQSPILHIPAGSDALWKETSSNVNQYFIICNNMSIFSLEFFTLQMSYIRSLMYTFFSK